MQANCPTLNRYAADDTSLGIPLMAAAPASSRWLGRLAKLLGLAGARFPLLRVRIAGLWRSW